MFHQIGLEKERRAQEAAQNAPLVNARLLLGTRVVRMFSFGALAPVLFLHLESLGFSSSDIATLFTCALFGDLAMTFPLTTRADRWGRRRTLIFGASLKAGAGLVFTLSKNYWVLVAAATLGVITPTGNEIGPFMAVEQASLTASLKGKVDEAAVTRSFSIYNFVGYLSLACGSFIGGLIVSNFGGQLQDGYNAVFSLYALAGLLMMLLYSMLSSDIEVNDQNKIAPVVVEEPKKAAATGDTTAKNEQQEGDKDEESQTFLKTQTTPPLPSPAPTAAAAETTTQESQSWILRVSGLKRMKSLKTVLTLALLFVLDSFAGGFVMQTLIVAWFAKKYGLSPEWLGSMVSGVNVLAGLSALAVNPLVSRIGSLRTAVYTHLPSNILLILVALMPDANSAVAMLFARSSLSQMDVPARQAFVAMSVDADERSAAGGITNIVRSFGVAVAPLFWGPLMSADPDSFDFKLPFIIAGGLKIVYDIALFILFRSFSPPDTGL